ncbi:hypothetical protein BCF11_0766 [Collimonas sp. PA-H2]|nr:hypothetical protein BCF11_0766 [Collimonas sp. PA-H2]
MEGAVQSWTAGMQASALLRAEISYSGGQQGKVIYQCRNLPDFATMVRSTNSEPLWLLGLKVMK